MDLLDIPLEWSWIVALAKTLSAISISILAVVMFRRFASNKKRLALLWAIMFAFYASGAWLTSIYAMILITNPEFPNASFSTVLTGILFGMGTSFLLRFVIEVYGGERGTILLRAGFYPVFGVMCIASAIAVGIWIVNQVIWTIGGYLLIVIAAMVYLVVFAGSFKIAQRLRSEARPDVGEDRARILAMMKGSLAAIVWFACSVADAFLTPLPYYTWLNPIGWVSMTFAMYWYYHAYGKSAQKE